MNFSETAKSRFSKNQTMRSTTDSKFMYSAAEQEKKNIEKIKKQQVSSRFRFVRLYIAFNLI